MTQIEDQIRTRLLKEQDAWDREREKMENEIRATAEGVVKTVHVTPGQAVESGELLVELD